MGKEDVATYTVEYYSATPHRNGIGPSVDGDDPRVRHAEEVSQEESDKYRILTHTHMKSRKWYG